MRVSLALLALCLFLGCYLLYGLPEQAGSAMLAEAPPIGDTNQHQGHARVERTALQDETARKPPSQAKLMPNAPSGRCSRSAAIKQELITSAQAGLADSLLAKIGRQEIRHMNLELSPEDWRSIGVIMTQYEESARPLAKTRFERIMVIARQRIAAGLAEEHPWVPPTDARYEEVQAAFREAQKPRTSEEIVQVIDRKIIRIAPHEDPALFEVMRQYQNSWQETAMRLELIAANSVTSTR